MASLYTECASNIRLLFDQISTVRLICMEGKTAFKENKITNTSIQNDFAETTHTKIGQKVPLFTDRIPKGVKHNIEMKLFKFNVIKQSFFPANTHLYGVILID